MKNLSNEFKSLVFIIAGFLLLMACLNMPYGYYNLIKLTTTAAAVFGIIVHQNSKLLVIVFSLIVLLFNPIFPVFNFDKSFWVYVDLVIFGLFLERSIYFFTEED
jgi:hypothetical protein